MRDKIEDLVREKKISKEEQIGVIDYWIGQLFDLKARLAAGQFPKKGGTRSRPR
jgi:hypothetical protein